MMGRTIKQLHDDGLILLDCISGSTAYGLDLPHSDIDKRGVFYAPRAAFFRSEALTQLSSDSGDYAYTELGRFFELLIKGNPTMIELLNTPKDKVLKKHSMFDKINRAYYLSKTCKDTFAGYAMTQIRKARGLNKKIYNPIDKERKTVLDFCFVPSGQGTIPLVDFLEERKLDMDNCGLSKVPHMTDVYGLYHAIGKGYKGIFKTTTSNDVLLTSVDKKDSPITYMSFQKSAYSRYCKEYKEYWEWVEKRNEERFKNTLSHGKNYDSKNMMHTFRLLNMAEEIAVHGEVIVKRPDRAFLLKIRAGDYDYEELLNMAEDKIESMKAAYEVSDLPEKPNEPKLKSLLQEFREELYLI